MATFISLLIGLGIIASSAEVTDEVVDQHWDILMGDIDMM